MLTKDNPTKSSSAVSFFSSPFLKRFSAEFPLYLFTLLLLGGLVLGAFAACGVQMDEQKTFIPMFFSGIPAIEGGFFKAFSTLLLNMLIVLITLFLSGITAFGVVAVPLILLFKGIFTGVAAVSFFYITPEGGLLRAALSYMPAMALMSFLLLLFSVRVFFFSRSFSRSFFSSGKAETPDFTEYLKDFLLFLFFSVLVSLLGAFCTLFYTQFLV